MQTCTRRHRPLFPAAVRPAALACALVAGLGASMLPVAASATPAGLEPYRDTIERLRADPDAGQVRGELASYEAWLRAATSHEAYGQDDALRRVKARLDAQQALIEARLDLAHTRTETDRTRARARELDRRIAAARTQLELLRRHNERIQKRGQ